MVSGQLKPGDRLPSLSQLKAEYGVSVHGPAPYATCGNTASRTAFGPPGLRRLLPESTCCRPVDPPPPV
ncbi:hypothetical protein ACFQ0D_27070 [Micromonospora zhanjiangensis]